MKAMECLGAMLCGVSLGAVVALMFAPYDGKHMRKSVCHMLRKSGLPYADEWMCHCNDEAKDAEHDVEHQTR